MSIGAILGTSVGTAAYTSATVDREATIDVVADSNGLIALAAGDESSDFIAERTDGQLTIDLTTTGAGGVNTNSEYAFGDTTDAANTYAFSVTNQDAAERTVTIDYTLDDATGLVDTTDHLVFSIYNADGTAAEKDVDENIISVVTENASYDLTAAANTTYHVVLEIDTTNLEDGTAASDVNLSGALGFQV